MEGNPRINCALLCIHCLVTVFIAKCIPPRVDVQVAEYFLTLSQQVYRYFRATPLADRRINNHSSSNAPPQTLHCLVEITEGSNVHQTNHPSTPARSWTKGEIHPSPSFPHWPWGCCLQTDSPQLRCINQFTCWCNSARGRKNSWIDYYSPNRQSNVFLFCFNAIDCSATLIRVYPLKRFN